MVYTGIHQLYLVDFGVFKRNVCSTLFGLMIPADVFSFGRWLDTIDETTRVFRHGFA
jgi:hypothetical protein